MHLHTLQLEASGQDRARHISRRLACSSMTSAPKWTSSRTFAAALGEGDLSEKLKKRITLNGKAARFTWMVTTGSIAAIMSGQSYDCRPPGRWSRKRKR